jgi:hypothetical protein
MAALCTVTLLKASSSQPSSTRLGYSGETLDLEILDRMMAVAGVATPLEGIILE